MTTSISSPINQSALETLIGLVEHVTFQSEDSGFSVLKVKANGHRELVTVVGVTPPVTAGEWIETSGRWAHDRKFGQQFKIESIKTTRPDTLEGIERYLGSGLIKGIGPHFAKRLVEKFGADVFEIIENKSSRLLYVEGIGDVRRRKITRGWLEQKSVREIMVFLHSHGVSTSRAFRIYKTYGEKAIEVVRENPYRLAHDIWGIGFKTADAIAASLGIDPQSDIRARAGVEFVLASLTEDGHCAFPRQGLTEKTMKMLEIPEHVISNAIDHALEEKRLIARPEFGDRNLLYLASLDTAEAMLTRNLLTLAKGKHPCPPIDVPAAIAWVEQKTGLTLAESQRTALATAVKSKVLIITGGPGVGKTTLVNAIVRVLAAKKLNVVLAAPTGRAAHRMSETSGREAKTIHRLLEFDPKGGFKRDQKRPLEQVIRYGITFRVGDKVIQTVNDYEKEVWNGDIGRIVMLDDIEGEATLDFDGKTLTYNYDEFDELQHAYAITIHKAQGSEYPCVVIPIHMQHYMLLHRAIVYTGITRGRKLVVLVGAVKALSMAVKRIDSLKRITTLKERLRLVDM